MGSPSSKRFSTDGPGVFTATVLALGTCLLVPAQGDGAPRRAVPLAPCLNRNPANLTARNIPDDFEILPGAEKHVRWSAQLGDFSYGGPVVAGGKVLVGTNNRHPRDPRVQGDKGIVMCFDVATGRFLWQAVHDKLPDTKFNDAAEQGIASSPAVDGDRVYYVSNRAEVVCTDLDGDPKHPGQARILWTFDMIRELGVFPRYLAVSSPLIVDDLVYVVTGNGVNGSGRLPAPRAPSFIAVNKKTGKLVWQCNLPGMNVKDGQYSSPVYARPRGGRAQVLFPGGDGWLYALAPRTGKLIWKFDCSRPQEHFFAMPVVHDDKVYIGLGRSPERGPGRGVLWCVRLDGEGDVSETHAVWCFGDKADRTISKRRRYPFGRTLSTCVIHEDLVYVADLEGYLHCLDAQTGRHYWSHDTKAECWASPYYADGKVFLGNNEGVLSIFRHGKKRPLPKTIHVIAPLRARAMTVADNVLYLMTDSMLYAIERKP